MKETKLRKKIWRLEYEVRIDPENTEAHNDLALAYNQIGRNQEAVDELKEAIRLKDDYTEALFSLGLVYGVLGRNAEAAMAYRTIKITPDEAEYYYYLALAYKKLGRFEDAIDTLKKAIRIKDGYTDAFVFIGLIYGDMGRFRRVGRPFVNK